eukprot:gnl/MRDRNA2_/MRDRNA2_85729_c4_seq1.p1 gnl/MRDRNA2_/MRDRNA2_85729_c4~~gnl/MRDRNA2_/MRDRNA2_85729_c4_seq1.p1  ORF type:complete len:328 (+),score=69.34 gnl/MRDRNA2_/MRDRNA2_85729_c4_seq1:46-984(+)
MASRKKSPRLTLGSPGTGAMWGREASGSSAQSPRVSPGSPREKRRQVAARSPHSRPQDRSALQYDNCFGQSAAILEDLSPLEASSQIMRDLAQTFLDMDQSKSSHHSKASKEEKQAREWTISQIHSVGDHVHYLEETLQRDKSFSSEIASSLAKYSQHQKRDIEEFEADANQLHELDFLVRQSLPEQLQAMMSLASEMQGQLNRKADALQIRAKMQMLDVRISSLEEGLHEKIDRKDYQSSARDVIKPAYVTRQQMARACFRMMNCFMEGENNIKPDAPETVVKSPRGKGRGGSFKNSARERPSTFRTINSP